jgi:hypothetical protein
MKRCSSPDHPHCTAWVMPGAQACAHGHGSRRGGRRGGAADALGSSFDMLQPVRAAAAGDAIRPGPTWRAGACLATRSPARTCTSAVSTRARPAGARRSSSSCAACRPTRPLN